MSITTTYKHQQQPQPSGGGGKMADGLGFSEYNEILPNQAPAKTPMLQACDREKMTLKTPTTDEQYKALVDKYEKSKSWPAFDPENCGEVPLTVETALAALINSQVEGDKVQKALLELLYVTIPKYRPDLYAATRYVKAQPGGGGANLRYQDSVALFVYTIELYDQDSLEVDVLDPKLDAKKATTVIEKMLDQRELDVIKELSAHYDREEGPSCRQTFHKIWDEVLLDAEKVAKDDLNEFLSMQIAERVNAMRSARMSAPGTAELIKILQEGRSSDVPLMKTLVEDEDWFSKATARLTTKQDQARLSRIRDILRQKVRKGTKLNLGDFGAGHSTTLQLYGGMNASLRGLENANTAELQFLDTLPNRASEPLTEAHVEKAKVVFEGKAKARAEFNKWRSLFFVVTEALDRLPVDNKKTNTYRGINLEFTEVQFGTGKYFAWPAFSSTSGSRPEALKFASNGTGGNGTLFIITKVKEGRDVHLFSRFPEEDEVLLQPQSYFKVVHRTTERENIINRSGPLITVEQLNLRKVDECIPESPIARMVWITHCNAVDSVPFSHFERLHLDGTFRGPLFELIRRLWSELKFSQNLSKSNAEKYKELVSLFCSKGAENPNSAIVRLEDFALVGRGKACDQGVDALEGCRGITQEHKEQLSKLNQGACAEFKTEKWNLTVETDTITKRCVSLVHPKVTEPQVQDGHLDLGKKTKMHVKKYPPILQSFDYHDYLAVFLRTLKRRSDTVVPARSERFFLLEGHAGGSYLDRHLDHGDNVVLTLRGIPSVASVVFSVGGHVAFINHENHVVFLTASSEQGDTSASLFATRTEQSASREKRLTRRSEIVQNNLFFLYLDDFDKELEGPSDYYDVLCLEMVGQEKLRLVFKRVPAPGGESSIFNLDNNDDGTIPLFIKRERIDFSPFRHIYKVLHRKRNGEVDGLKHTFIPMNSASFMRRSVEYMCPFVVEPMLTGRHLLLETSKKDGRTLLRRQDRLNCSMDEYLPYPFTSFVYLSWASWIPSVFLSALMLVLLALVAMKYFLYTNTVVEVFPYLVIAIECTLVIFFNLFRADLIKIVAENAPHAQSRGSTSTLLLLALPIAYATALYQIPTIMAFSTQRFDTELTEMLTLADVLNKTLSVFIGIVLLMLIWLFTVTNQLMYDRAQNTVDEVRIAPASIFVDPKDWVVKHLQFAAYLEDVSTAWQLPTQIALYTMFLLYVLSLVCVVVTLDMGEQKHLLHINLRHSLMIFTYLSAALFYILYLLRRWEKFGPAFRLALSQRFREVCLMPGTTPENLVLLINTVDQHPIEWFVPSFKGASKVATWTMGLMLASMHLSVFIVLYITATPDFCTVQLGDLSTRTFKTVNVFSVGLPKYGDVPRSIPADIDWGTTNYLAIGRYRHLPGYYQHERYGIYSCDIIGCETSLSVGRPRTIERFSNPAVCQQMFSLVLANDTKRVNRPFVTYRLRVNTDNVVWQQAQSYAVVNQGIFVLMECRSELGVHVERMCLMTRTKEIWHEEPGVSQNVQEL